MAAPNPTGQSLAIVGASTRAAAFSAKRAGYHPITADLFADQDLREIATSTRITPYPNGLLDWLRTVEPTAWMYTGALENHPELVDAMGWIAPLWGNSGDVLKCVRQPWNLMDVLRDASLEFPEIRALSPNVPTDGEWLLKTYHGASGSGVRPAASVEPPLDADSKSDDFEPVYQRRVAGTSCSAVFLAGDVPPILLGITRQLIGESWLHACGFQYGGSIGPWPVAAPIRQHIARIGEVIAERFELVGLFGVDFMLDGDHVWTLEVNPRYTASVEIVERMTAQSAIAAHAAACNGESLSVWSTPTTSPPKPKCHGKAILYAPSEVTISQHFAEWSLEAARVLPWATMGDVSPAGTVIEAGRPVVTFFVEGADVAEVEALLRTRAAEVERRLYA